MNKKIEDILNNAKKVRLDETQKTKMREDFFSFMDNNPMPSSQHTPAIISPFHFKFSTVAVVILIFFTSYIGVTEASVPGDLFYPIKTHVNETIMREIAFTNEAKSDAARKILDRRLKEASILASQKEIEPKQWETVSNGIEDAVTEVVSSIEEMTDDKEVSSAISAIEDHYIVLESNEAIFREIHENDLADIDELEILEEINHYQEQAEAASELISSEINHTLDSEELQLELITEATELIQPEKEL